MSGETKLTYNQLISLATFKELSSYLLDTKESVSRQMLKNLLKETDKRKFSALFESLNFQKNKNFFDFTILDFVINKLLKVLSCPRNRGFDQFYKNIQNKQGEVDYSPLSVFRFNVRASYSQLVEAFKNISQPLNPASPKYNTGPKTPLYLYLMYKKIIKTTLFCIFTQKSSTSENSQTENKVEMPISIEKLRNQQESQLGFLNY